MQRSVAATRNGLLARINAANAQLNAFISIAQHNESTDDALPQLAVAVKDNIHVREFATTCASPMLQAFAPSWDAACVSALKAAGAFIVGKTNMDEFGMGSYSIHSTVGPVRNPLNTALSAGGSSGGSAAAVAARLVPAALGSDTGGSIRLPASYCGVVGFKPTYGRISRDGLVAYASSLDTVGIVGDSVGTVQRVFGIAAQATGGVRDMTSFQRTTPVRAMRLAGLRVGVLAEMQPSDLLSAGAKDNLDLALDYFSRAGARIEPVSIPSLNYALATYYIHAMVEAASCLARYPLAGSNADFGAHVRQRVALGRHLASHQQATRFLSKAIALRQQQRADLERVLAHFDILIGPTSIGPAPTLASVASDPSDLFSPERWEGVLQSDFDNSHLEPLLADLLTVPASLAGLPAISLPIHRGSVVCGVQLIAGHSCDEELLQIAMQAMDLVRTSGDTQSGGAQSGDAQSGDA